MIFIIMWIGAMVITMNSSLLGGKLSLLQCICLLGYCSFPCVISALLVRVILKFLPGIGKLIIVCISFYWSTKGIFILYFFIFLASVSFISQNIEERKKIVDLFYYLLLIGLLMQHLFFLYFLILLLRFVFFLLFLF